MTIKSTFVRNMLLGYDRQLVTARRLAKYRRSLRAAQAEDAVSIPREVKRRQLVERVAKEIVENLIIAGADNPVVHEIKAQLEKEFGEELYFEFPLTEQDLQIFRETPGGPQEIANHEKMHLLNRLWKITLDKVDETML
ncbi:MAG: hypothetical protein D6E12_02445 [Desulfovibrio sp.]|nr:MAG: hypothetical protein D6E12_02445 [Desulfovibrio sp.]